MLPSPAARLLVGVKMAVRLKPLPLSSPKLPPVTVMLPVWLVWSQLQLLPGSSLKLKLMSAVSPAFKAVASALIDKVGKVVSTR